MNIILKKRKHLIFLLVITYSATLSLFFLSSKTLSNGGLNNVSENVDLPYSIKSANNDITDPIITFVKPDINDTSIRTRYYDIIVNITDTNPPLLGKVIIEISNVNTSFFNASMLQDQGGLWFFSWNNLTSYPNEKSYTIRVRATDSSSNENSGLSNDLFIILSVFETRVPNLLNAVLYVILVILAIALIMVYVNKKRTILKTLN